MFYLDWQIIRGDTIDACRRMDGKLPLPSDQIMRQLHIEHLADRHVSMANNNLSGGEKQKISIARCLFRDTDVLILDEPTNTLDVQTLNWMHNFIENTDKTLLYISHDEAFTALADNIIRL